MKLIQSFNDWERMYESAKTDRGILPLNEKEGFDLMAWLKQQANLAKATATIEKAVAELYKAKTAKLQATRNFAEEWETVVKAKKADVRSKFDAKIAKLTDQGAKDALKAEKKSTVEALEQQLSDLKKSKETQFIQAEVDDEKDAESKVSEITGLDMPDWGKTYVNALKTQKENAERVKYDELKYAEDDEARAKAQKRLSAKMREDAAAMAEAAANANTKSDSDADTAITAVNTEKKNDPNTDEAEFKDGKKKLSDALSKYKDANAELGKVKSLATAFKTAKSEADSADEQSKEQKELAADNAKSKFDAAVDGFEAAKKKAMNAFSSANAWATSKKSGTPTDDISRIIQQIEASKGISNSLEAVNLSED